MKKLILSLIVVHLVIVCNYSDSFYKGSHLTNDALYKLVNNRFVPDVKGYVNSFENDGRQSGNLVFQIDSFPNFQGFPITLTGVSSEGGIICNMNSDNNLEIIYNAGFTVNVIKIDGTQLPGWPKTVSPYPTQCAPAFGDIDGDGHGEIVVTTSGTTSGGYIYAWHTDGSVVSGFPVNHGYTTRTPVLADLDNDGKLEIIVSLRGANQEFVYRGNGTVFPGWPKQMNAVPASSASVGDIDGDGIPEIIAESYTTIFAWKANGDSIPGFPFVLPGGEVLSYSSPVLADVDNDGFREIIFGTHNLSTGAGKVFVLKKDGSVLSGWPQSVGHWIYGPPAVGFIDNDNIMDIAVGDQVVSFTPVDYVYAWNRNGTQLSGFPIGPVNAVNNQISLADLNNDGHIDLMFDDNTTSAQGFGKYLAYKYDGTPLPGWPITTTGTTFFQMPCLASLNNSGILDIVGGTQVGLSSTNLYLWNTGLNYNPNNVIIPMWQYNSRHNGVYGDNQLVKIKNHYSEIPEKFEINQNYPNPFNPSTTISYELAAQSTVSISIYDELGRVVQTLVNSTQNAGRYQISWDGTNFSSGIYFYKISAVSTNAGGAESFSKTKTMVLLK